MSKVRDFFKRDVDAVDWIADMRKLLYHTVLEHFEGGEPPTTYLANGYYHLYWFLEALEQDIKDGNI